MNSELLATGTRIDRPTPTCVKYHRKYISVIVLYKRKTKS